MTDFTEWIKRTKKYLSGWFWYLKYKPDSTDEDEEPLTVAQYFDIFHPGWDNVDHGTDSDGNTCVMALLEHCHRSSFVPVEIFQRMIDSGMDVTVQNTLGETAIHIIIDMCRTGDSSNVNSKLVGMLVSKAKERGCLNVSDKKHGNSCLLAALDKRMITDTVRDYHNVLDEIIMNMLDNGCDVNFTNKKGVSALMIAIAFGTDDAQLSSAVAERILQIAVEVARQQGNVEHLEVCDWFQLNMGYSLLMLALSARAYLPRNMKDGPVRFSDETLIRLIDSGINVNFQDSGINVEFQTGKCGKSALMVAIEEKRSLDLIKHLLQSGADTTLEDKQGSTALFLALTLTDNRVNEPWELDYIMEHFPLRRTDNIINYQTLVDLLLEFHPCIKECELYGAIAAAHTERGRPPQSYPELPQKLVVTGKVMPLPYGGNHPMFREDAICAKSPLSFALSHGNNLTVSKFFISAGFLNTFDIESSAQTYSDLVRGRNTVGADAECVVEAFYCQPKRLELLSFVKVSTCLGFGPERKLNISATGLPPSLQRALMFQI